MYTRELILTEIEACKRKEARDTIRKRYIFYTMLYAMATVGCLMVAFLLSTYPDHEDMMGAGICMAFGVMLPIYLISHLSDEWATWKEPTPNEKEELGERIV